MYMEEKMKKGLSNKIVSIILSVILSAVMLFSATGCGSSNSTDSGSASSVETLDVTIGGTEADSDSSADSSSEAVSVLGEGSTQFMFTVTDADGNEKAFEIHTDAQTVGDALSENGLIEGEDSEYGLYVTTVDGTTLDYDNDGMYWAFYIDGEYASTGVDSTEVTAGAEYAFKAEKQ